MEHMVKGGKGSNDLKFNYVGYMNNFEGPFVLVDGLQRLTAALLFMSDKLPVFKIYFTEFEDRLPLHYGFRFFINALPTRADVLRWYIELNSGGTVHADVEIRRVKNLLNKEIKHE